MLLLLLLLLWLLLLLLLWLQLEQRLPRRSAAASLPRNGPKVGRRALALAVAGLAR